MRQKSRQAAPSPMSAWMDLATEVTQQTVFGMTKLFSGLFPSAGGDVATPEPAWTTPHTVDLTLDSVILRNFSCGVSGPVTLICAPLALHRATLADMAPGHSLVATLLAAGLSRLYVADWQSATEATRLRTIDNCLADLNVLVDQFAEPVNLVGLCHGGWLAVAYAARFPEKVRRLVVAAAPIDVEVAESHLSRIASATPDATFEQIVRFGGGIVRGAQALRAWHPAPLTGDTIAKALQIPPHGDAARQATRRFAEWFHATMDLPGPLYLDTVRKIFLENRLARGTLTILGRHIDPRAIRMPLCVLTGTEDEIVTATQTTALARLVATPPDDIRIIAARSNHLGLFMGQTVLSSTWPEIGAWLRDHDTARHPKQAQTPRSRALRAAGGRQ